MEGLVSVCLKHSSVIVPRIGREIRAVKMSMSVLNLLVLIWDVRMGQVVLINQEVMSKLSAHLFAYLE